MGMEGTGLSVADALALQDRRGGDGMFGDGNGIFPILPAGVGRQWHVRW